MYLRTCRPREASDQTAHMRSLIGSFTGHLNSQSFFMQTTKNDQTAWMYWLICVYILAHMSECTFSQVMVYMINTEQKCVLDVYVEQRLKSANKSLPSLIRASLSFTALLDTVECINEEQRP